MRRAQRLLQQSRVITRRVLACSRVPCLRTKLSPPRIGRAAGARGRWLTLCGETREHEFTSPRTALRHHPTIIPPGGSDDFGTEVVGGAAQSAAQQLALRKGPIACGVVFSAGCSVLLSVPVTTAYRPSHHSKPSKISHHLPLKALFSHLFKSRRKMRMFPLENGRFQVYIIGCSRSGDSGVFSATPPEL